MEYSTCDLIKAVKIEAENRKTSAAFNGEYSDGGSGRLFDQVKYYEMGRDNIYPKEWEKYAKHVDPEYEEYLRLKSKFS